MPSNLEKTSWRRSCARAGGRSSAIVTDAVDNVIGRMLASHPSVTEHLERAQGNVTGKFPETAVFHGVRRNGEWVATLRFELQQGVRRRAERAGEHHHHGGARPRSGSTWSPTPCSTLFRGDGAHLRRQVIACAGTRVCAAPSAPLPPDRAVGSQRTCRSSTSARVLVTEVGFPVLTGLDQAEHARRRHSAPIGKWQRRTYPADHQRRSLA